MSFILFWLIIFKNIGDSFSFEIVQNQKLINNVVESGKRW